MCQITEPKKMTQINEKTRIGLTSSQLVGIVVFIFGVGAGFSVFGSDANQAKEISKENKSEIQMLKQDMQIKNAETLKMFYEIHESTTRIEEQLKQKKDK